MYMKCFASIRAVSRSSQQDAGWYMTRPHDKSMGCSVRWSACASAYSLSLLPRRALQHACRTCADGSRIKVSTEVNKSLSEPI